MPKNESKNIGKLDYRLLNLSPEEIKSRLLELIRDKSLFEGDIILPSGRISNHYLDIKETTLGAEGAFLASLAILHNLKEDIEYLGGLEDKVYSLATTVSQLAFIRGQHIDSFFVLNEARQRGYSKWIAGPLKQGGKVCIVHDLVIDGLKVVECIRKVQEEARAEIVQVITIVDRLDGAGKRLQDLGIDYTAICTMEDIVPDKSC